MQVHQILIQFSATVGTMSLHHQVQFFSSSGKQEKVQLLGFQPSRTGAGTLEALGHSPSLMAGVGIFSLRLTRAIKPTGAAQCRLTRAV